MALADDLSKFARIANGAFNSIGANSTSITTLSIGGVSVNSTAFSGAANSATFANSSVTNTFTVGTASYFVANGNVGIGTSSPVFKLDVYSSSGDSVVAVRSAASGAGIIRTVGSNTTFAAYNALVSTELSGAQQWYIGGDGVANTIIFKNGTTNTACFTASGRLGIGTMSPSSPLEVSSTSQFSGIALTGSGRAWSVGSSSNAAVNINYQHDALLFTASGTERMRIDASGNVAINSTNTTSAEFRVDTTGGGGYGRTSPNIWLNNSNDPSIRLMNTSNVTLNHSATMYVPGGAGGWAVTCDTNNAFDLFVDISGNFTARGNVTAYSDERLKKDVVHLKNALAKITKLRGVSYTRIDTEDHTIGFIAQELQKHVPEVVREGPEGYLTVSYGNLAALLVEAVKEQQQQIDYLKEEVAALKAKILE